MNLAVIQFQGHQFLVKPGDKIQVDKLPVEEGKKIEIKEVLLVADEKGKVKIGTPVLKKTVVEGKVVAQKKGKKIKILRFRAKSRYRKRKGFRPELTEIEITAIKNG